MGIESNKASMFHGLDHIGLTVPDVAAAVNFYQDVFGAKVIFHMGPLDSRDMPKTESGKDWTAAYINVEDANVEFVGIELVPGLVMEIYQYHRPEGGNRKPPKNSDYGGHHIALRVADVVEAAQYMQSKGFTLMDGPIVPPDGPLEGSKAWYLLDPWNNQFELMEYKHMAFMKN